MSLSSQPWGWFGITPPRSSTLHSVYVLVCSILFALRGKKQGKDLKRSWTLCIFPRHLCDLPSTFEPGRFKVVSHGWGHLSQPLDQQQDECHKQQVHDSSCCIYWLMKCHFHAFKTLQWVVAIMASRQSRWTKAEKPTRLVAWSFSARWEEIIKGQRSTARLLFCIWMLNSRKGRG